MALFILALFGVTFFFLVGVTLSKYGYVLSGSAFLVLAFITCLIAAGAVGTKVPV
jgi:hypothetical protein